MCGARWWELCWLKSELGDRNWLVSIYVSERVLICGAKWTFWPLWFLLSKVFFILKFKGKVHLNKHVYLKHGSSLLPAPNHCDPFWDQILKRFLPLCLLASCLIPHVSCALEVSSELCYRGPDPFIITCPYPCEFPTLMPWYWRLLSITGMTHYAFSFSISSFHVSTCPSPR